MIHGNIHLINSCKSFLHEGNYYILTRVSPDIDDTLAPFFEHAPLILQHPALFQYRGMHENSILFHFVAISGGYSVSLSPAQVLNMYAGEFDMKKHEPIYTINLKRTVGSKTVTLASRMTDIKEAMILS